MWSLIVLILGTLPPVGTVQHGFETKDACESEATLYCWPPKQRVYKCKCEWGLVTQGDKS